MNVPELMDDRNPRLSPDELTALCTSQCLSTLNSARTTIQQGCTSSTDVLNFNDVLYPRKLLGYLKGHSDPN
jgi:hypothetical protein